MEFWRGTGLFREYNLYLYKLGNLSSLSPICERTNNPQVHPNHLMLRFSRLKSEILLDNMKQWSASYVLHIDITTPLA